MEKWGVRLWILLHFYDGVDFTFTLTLWSGRGGGGNSLTSPRFFNWVLKWKKVAKTARWNRSSGQPHWCLQRKKGSPHKKNILSGYYQVFWGAESRKCYQPVDELYVGKGGMWGFSVLLYEFKTNRIRFGVSLLENIQNNKKKALRYFNYNSQPNIRINCYVNKL